MIALAFGFSTPHRQVIYTFYCNERQPKKQTCHFHYLQQKKKSEKKKMKGKANND